MLRRLSNRYATICEQDGSSSSGAPICWEPRTRSSFAGIRAHGRPRLPSRILPPTGRSYQLDLQYPRQPAARDRKWNVARLPSLAAGSTGHKSLSLCGPRRAGPVGAQTRRWRGLAWRTSKLVGMPFKHPATAGSPQPWRAAHASASTHHRQYGRPLTACAYLRKTQEGQLQYPGERDD